MKPIDLTVKPDDKESSMCCGPRTPELYVELDVNPELPAEGVMTVRYKVTELTVRTPEENDSKDSCYRPLVRICMQINEILDAHEEDSAPKTDRQQSSDALDEMISPKSKKAVVVVAD